MNDHILACKVFEEELLSMGVDHDSATWLEMGLHDQPDNLRREIESAIKSAEANPRVDRILLAYGLCGNGLIGVRAGRVPLVLPHSHDCISILLGGIRRHEDLLKNSPGIYFYSPGWIRERRVPGPDREAFIRKRYEERYPDDPDMVDDLVEADSETFSHHQCAAYVDMTGNQEAEEYCKQCAKSLGWEFRRLESDPSMLHDLVHGPHDPERFLQVPPGHRIALDASSTLVARPA